MPHDCQTCSHDPQKLHSAAVMPQLYALLQLIDWGLLPKAFLGVLALLCGNGYIVGINQIFDDDIDKVNKPFLPIASGKLFQMCFACLLHIKALSMHDPCCWTLSRKHTNGHWPLLCTPVRLAQTLSHTAPLPHAHSRQPTDQLSDMSYNCQINC